MTGDYETFADIYMDGTIVASASGENAAQISVQPGVHVFRVALDGYQAVEKRVQVLERGEQRVNFSLAPEKSEWEGVQ